jgi:hypothetical protein
MKNFKSSKQNMELSGSCGECHNSHDWAFLKYGADTVAQMNVCALTMVKQKNLKYYPFLMLRDGLNGIRTQYNVRLKIFIQISIIYWFIVSLYIFIFRTFCLTNITSMFVTYHFNIQQDSLSRKNLGKCRNIISTAEE